MKRVRMLLRVSSNQQLEADGDLSVQRELVMEYVGSREDWILEEKEYFEGSKSGYRNAVGERETLQEALADAQKQEYDILVAYKDDRVGRRMWEMGAYIMALKNFGVDTYTVKDGCISPETDDIMGQMMLALRYGNAQKSSSDTGMRVKDTAQKLVRKGKFMGGTAPYGYELVLSGELSKHGRALHTLRIIPEQAEVVKYIYRLSFNQEYGSSKIAKLLNEDEVYSKLAPRDVWKSGTITSILTNPIYAGHVAYKRRERMNGKYHRLDSQEWIKASEPDEKIKIIDGELWNFVQEKRKRRADKYMKKPENKDVHVIKRNCGTLPLIDVIYCGYCEGKLTNGSKYNYWTIRGTGERRASKIPIYRCQNAMQGVPHNKVKQFRADGVEKIIFDCLAEYIDRLKNNEDIFADILSSRQSVKKTMESDICRGKEELDRIRKGIEVMENSIPDALTGDYALTLEELARVIRKHQKREEQLRIHLREQEKKLKDADAAREEWDRFRERMPTWKKIFEETDMDTKRVLINTLIERIDVTNEQITVRFKVPLSEFQSRINIDSSTTPYKHDSG